MSGLLRVECCSKFRPSPCQPGIFKFWLTSVRTSRTRVGSKNDLHEFFHFVSRGMHETSGTVAGICRVRANSTAEPGAMLKMLRQRRKCRVYELGSPPMVRACCGYGRRRAMCKVSLGACRVTTGRRGGAFPAFARSALIDTVAARLLAMVAGDPWPEAARENRVPLRRIGGMLERNRILRGCSESIRAWRLTFRQLLASNRHDRT